MWFTYALISGLLFAINRLQVRSLLKKQIDPIAFMALHEMFAGLLLLPFAIKGAYLPNTTWHWALLVMIMALIFGTDFFGFLALKRIEASLFQIIGQARHIVVLFGAFVAFHEPLQAIKYLAVGLIIFGVAVTLMHKNRRQPVDGIAYAFASTVSISLATLAVKAEAGAIPTLLLASLGLCAAGVISSLIVASRKIPIKPLLQTTILRPLLLTSAVFAAFEYCFFAALSHGQASQVTPVTQSSLIFTLLGGYLFLHERDNLRRKLIGSALVVGGIILMYFV